MRPIIKATISSTLRFLLIFVIVAQSCQGDEHEPRNKPNAVEEIDLVSVTIYWQGTLESIDLEFADTDGDGVYTREDDWGVVPFKTGGVHRVYVSFIGKAGEPYPNNLTEEITKEKSDHLFCFNTPNAITTVTFKDDDSKGLPFGMYTEWTAGAANTEGQVKITLRHVPGTKSATCPAESDVDFEITFPMKVVQ